MRRERMAMATVLVAALATAVGAAKAATVVGGLPRRCAPEPHMRLLLHECSSLISSELTTELQKLEAYAKSIALRHSASAMAAAASTETMPCVSITASAPPASPNARSLPRLHIRCGTQLIAACIVTLASMAQTYPIGQCGTHRCIWHKVRAAAACRSQASSPWQDHDLVFTLDCRRYS